MDRDLLIIIIVGGILTFATYYYAYQSGKGLTLWADVSPKNRVYYSISGIFAGLVFVYLFYFLGSICTIIWLFIFFFYLVFCNKI